jgi:hypothetical protein
MSASRAADLKPELKMKLDILISWLTLRQLDRHETSLSKTVANVKRAPAMKTMNRKQNGDSEALRTFPSKKTIREHGRHSQETRSSTTTAEIHKQDSQSNGDSQARRTITNSDDSRARRYRFSTKRRFSSTAMIQNRGGNPTSKTPTHEHGRDSKERRKYMSKTEIHQQDGDSQAGRRSTSKTTNLI